MANTALKAQLYQVLRTACLMPIMICPQVQKELHQNEEQDLGVTIAVSDFYKLSFSPAPC